MNAVNNLVISAIESTLSLPDPSTTLRYVQDDSVWIVSKNINISTPKNLVICVIQK